MSLSRPHHNEQTTSPTTSNPPNLPPLSLFRSAAGPAVQSRCPAAPVDLWSGRPRRSLILVRASGDILYHGDVQGAWVLDAGVEGDPAQVSSLAEAERETLQMIVRDDLSRQHFAARNSNVADFENGKFVPPATSSDGLSTSSTGTTKLSVLCVSRIAKFLLEKVEKSMVPLRCVLLKELFGEDFLEDDADVDFGFGCREVLPDDAVGVEGVGRAATDLDQNDAAPIELQVVSRLIPELNAATMLRNVLDSRFEVAETAVFDFDFTAAGRDFSADYSQEDWHVAFYQLPCDTWRDCRLGGGDTGPPAGFGMGHADLVEKLQDELRVEEREMEGFPRGGAFKSSSSAEWSDGGWGFQAVTGGGRVRSRHVQKVLGGFPGISFKKSLGARISLAARRGGNEKSKSLSLSKDSENHNPRDPPRDGTSTGGSSAGGGGPGPGASSKRNKQTAPDEFLRTFHEALDVLEEAMREQNFFTSFSRQMTDVAQAFAQSAHFGGFEFHTRRFTRLVVLSAGVSHPRFRNLKHFLGIVVERLLELSHNSPAPFALCYFAVWSVGHTGSG